MKKTFLTYKYLLPIVACAFIGELQAQEAFPKPTPMKAQMSEYWTPQPAVVTPGTQSKDVIVPAPSDAIILFDGENLSQWQSTKGGPAEWKLSKGAFTVDKSKGDIVTKRKFGDFQLHIEWMIPKDISGKSQGRGNSGLFLQDKYEIQILDCYNNQTYVNGQTGSVYKQTPPLANAMRKPGEWNSYEIIYKAPTFTKDGRYRTPPTVTVIQNGVLLQNHTTILGTTEYIGFPKVAPHGDGPLRLQSHGDPSEPISFRNIWVREL